MFSYTFDFHSHTMFSHLGSPKFGRISPASRARKGIKHRTETKTTTGNVSRHIVVTQVLELFYSSTHSQNDALLHRLVHTKLLSGSLDPELDLTPAQRRKALAGRVLELSGAAKLGRGEKSVRTGERNKASKRVREGLLEKEQEKQKVQLEEVRIDWFFLCNLQPITIPRPKIAETITQRSRNFSKICLERS